MLGWAAVILGAGHKIPQIVHILRSGEGVSRLSVLLQTLAHTAQAIHSYGQGDTPLVVLGLCNITLNAAITAAMFWVRRSAPVVPVVVVPPEGGKDGIGGKVGIVKRRGEDDDCTQTGFEVEDDGSRSDVIHHPDPRSPRFRGTTPGGPAASLAVF